MTAAMPPAFMFAGAIIWTIIIYLTGSIESSVTCRSPSCVGYSCPEVDCYRGTCSKDGLCNCSPCWIGSSCNKYKNEYYPEFISLYESVSIPNYSEVGDPVIQMRIVDADLVMTCDSNATDCDCSLVNFAIESGNDDHLFHIDVHSGHITLARSASDFRDLSFKLYVTVVNRDIEGASGGDIVGPKSYATVTITIGSGSKSAFLDDNHVADVDLSHHRHKRAATPVTNMTFYLFKTGQYNFTTVMSVGTKVHFQLQIQFPIGQMDLLVELFTPDNTSTIMVICNPQIVWIGSNIRFNVSEAQPVMDSLDGSLNYDRAVLDFGYVTNLGSPMNADNDSMIIIEWDAVMIDSNTTVNGSVYWVSAGAEYNSQNEIWIGQAGFTTVLDNFTSSNYPTFNVTAPSVLYLGSSAIFRVDMYIPLIVTDLVFEAFAPVNVTDAMSVCTALILGVGKNFECLQYTKIFPTFHSSASGLTNDRATLNIGHVINKGMRDNTPLTDSLISVEFVVHVPLNEDLIGQTMLVGATLEIGSDQIWAGQMSVVIANSTTSIMSVNPTLYMAPAVPVSINMPTTFDLNMTLDNNTDTGYTISVNVPLDNFRICTVSIAYQGINIPCTTDTLPVYSSTGTSGNYNKAVWDLGRLLNTGMRSWAADPQANIIQFKVIVIALNVSANAIGSSQSISATVTPTQGTTSSTTGSLYINSTGSGSVITTANSPLTNLTFGFGSSSVNINATTSVLVNVSLYPGVIYSPFQVEVSTPYYNSSNVFSICRMELTTVGKNLPCISQPVLNSSVTYYTKVNGTPSYRALLDFGSGCSLASYNGTYVPTYNDTLQLSIGVRVENHPYLASNPTNWIGIGLTYGPGMLWIGSQPITATKFYNIGYGVNATPYVNFAGQNNLTGVLNATAPGALVTFLVTIKLPPQTTADWVVTADIGSDTALTVCSVHVKEFGYGVPCLNKSVQMRSINRPDGSGRVTGWLELYKLTNLGNQPVNANGIFDNNSVVLEIAVQVMSGATPGSIHGVNISADFGMNGADASANLSILVGSYVAPLYSLTAPQPGFNFSQMPVNENASVASTVYKGETLIFTSEIIFPYYSQNDIAITFSTPAGSDVLDIVRYDVVFVGSNLPCLSKDMILSNITASQFEYAHDKGAINLGTVCHFPIDTTLSENDKVIVEVIATVVRNTTQPLNIAFPVQSQLSINGSVATTANIMLTLSNVISSAEYLSNEGAALANVIINVTNGTIVPLGPSEFYSVFADIVVPPNSTVFGLVDFVMPVYQSAVLTIVEAYVVSFGCNLGSFGLPTDFNVIYNSSNGTSQNDTAYISLGRITNTGHTYRSGKYQPQDDYIRVSLTVQMADCAAASKDSLHNISFGAKLGLPIFFRALPVIATRTLTETPDILISAVVNNSFLLYSTGAIITVTGGVWHSNLSKAEGYNTTILIYPPKYIQFGSLVSTTFIGPAPTVVNITGSPAFGLEFSHFYFTDLVNFTLTIQVLQVMPGSGNPEYTSVGVELVTNIIYRPTHMNQSGALFVNRLENLNFTVKMALIQQCVAVPLGMQSKFIQDCQITGSVSPIANWQPVNGRLNSATGWKAGSRLGQPSYLQVNFGNVTRVTSVTLQNPLSNSEFVNSFQMLYSNDGFNWINGEIVSVAAPYSTVSNPLVSPTDAIFIRLVILSSTTAAGMPAVQLEFIGCVTTTLSVAVAEFCNTYSGWQPPVTNPTDFYNRGFLGANGAVYFCDTNKLGEMSCFSSNNGALWKSIDDSVINVNIYLPSTGQLYGIDWKKRSFLVSEDQGATWMSVSTERYLWAKAQAGLLSAVNVPYVNNGNLSPGSAAPTGLVDSSNKWGAQYDGLYYGGTGSWKPVADWMQCCP